MSEETAPVEEVTATVEDVTPQGDDGADWKAESRKWEARAKADFEAASKWREFEVSQKTEYEKLADELSKYKDEAAQANAKAIRYEVAQTKGIPSEAIDLITGNDRESIEASSDKLAALIAAQSKTNTPRPDYNQGKVSGNSASPADQFAAALADLI
jgi:hypothetical protein